MQEKAFTSPTPERKESLKTSFDYSQKLLAASSGKSDAAKLQQQIIKSELDPEIKAIPAGELLKDVQKLIYVTGLEFKKDLNSEQLNSIYNVLQLADKRLQDAIFFQRTDLSSEQIDKLMDLWINLGKQQDNIKIKLKNLEK